jgi:multicomponent Na+:H+ antiporter subunit G
VNLLDWISAVLVVVGAALGTVGGLGLVRLPDVFARMHAATKAPTLGLVLVAAAAVLQQGDLSDVGLLVLVIMLQFLTAPVGAHLIGRASYDSGGMLDEGTVIDELAEADDRTE